MGKRPLLQVWLPKDRRERLSCDPPRESARRRRSGLRRRRAFARRKLSGRMRHQAWGHAENKQPCYATGLQGPVPPEVLDKITRLLERRSLSRRMLALIGAYGVR